MNLLLYRILPFVPLILLIGCEPKDASPSGPDVPSGNHAPDVPVNLAPANGATGVSIDQVGFAWAAADSDAADTLRYDLYLDNCNPPKRKAASSLRVTSFTMGLAVNATYYWYIAASDGKAVTNGHVGQFSTQQSNPAPVVMRRIQGGAFQMGSAGLSDPLEMPVHRVTVSDFWMDSADVTQADYRSLMGVNPSYFKNAPNAAVLPVEQITWYDAVLYCNARSRHEGRDTVYSYDSADGSLGAGCSKLVNLVTDYAKHGYRLPTEAEWEYACRAGSDADFYWGGSYPPRTHADTLVFDSNAVWFLNSPNTLLPVMSKKPNAFGLYDMAGNVWKYCNDWLGSYGADPVTDPTGPATGQAKVLRGGCFSNYDNCLRCAYRGQRPPNSRGGGSAGLRCVLR